MPIGFRGVAFSGKQGAGKTTVKDELSLIYQTRGLDTLTLSFAEPLKTVTKRLLDSLEVFSPLPLDWKYQYRTQLQLFGAGLREFHEDVWVDVMRGRIEKVPSKTVVLVDDLRYLNEARALKELGFFLVRLEASEELRASRGVTIKGANHSSETALDEYADFHVVVTENDALTPRDACELILEAIMDAEHKTRRRRVAAAAKE